MSSKTNGLKATTFGAIAWTVLLTASPVTNATKATITSSIHELKQNSDRQASSHVLE